MREGKGLSGIWKETRGLFCSSLSFLLLPLLPDVLQLPVVEEEVGPAGAVAAHDGHGVALDLVAGPAEDAQQEVQELVARMRSFGRLFRLALTAVGSGRPICVHFAAAQGTCWSSSPPLAGILPFRL